MKPLAERFRWRTVAPLDPELQCSKFCSTFVLMIGEATRRTVSLGGLAAAVAAATGMCSAKPQARRMRYEDRLAAHPLDRWNGLTVMAMAHIAGFADRIPAWLAMAREADQKLNTELLQHVFNTLLAGNADAIRTAQDPIAIDYPFDGVHTALILLGRADLLPPLHDKHLRGPESWSAFTMRAALALAAADEWEHAFEILERAGKTDCGVPIGRTKESLFWRYAYLHGRVETAMPRLAEMSFSPELPHLREYRKWKLRAYQIRAGLPSGRVPIIEGERPMGYVEAAAMQAAALGHDPSAADYAAQLRRAATRQTFEVALADGSRAVSIKNVPDPLLTATVQMAARRKDWTGAMALARMPADDAIIVPADAVLEAFLEERDWRGAATIAQEHDPRERPLSPGSDDARERDYIRLYTHLASAAAREGKHAAAAALLGMAKAADRTQGSARDRAAKTEDSLPWVETLLAGLAENRLPAKYLHVLTPAFLDRVEIVVKFPAPLRPASSRADAAAAAGSPIRYQEMLAARFSRFGADLDKMAMAHIGGFADRLPAWLGSAKQREDQFPAQPLRHVFDALLTGDVTAIGSALRHTAYPVSEIKDSLILLGRPELLPPLHDVYLPQLDTTEQRELTAGVALALAKVDEWDHVFRILEQARRTIGLDIGGGFEDMLWRFAYLHRRIDAVMPALAALPFSPGDPEAAERRKWRLKAYRIRAGMPGDRVPIVEDKQPIGYAEAAAMQIAALADDPSAVEYAGTLRRAVKIRPEIVGIAIYGTSRSVSHLPQVLFTAEAQIAARRRDYRRAAALARMPIPSMHFDPSRILIDAFLDERDWRGAAAIVREHDPREQPLAPGDDDEREREYITIHCHLAIAAAREGDEADAAALLASAKEVHRSYRLKHEGEADTEDAFLQFDSQLAGVAERRLPREYLFVLNSPFILPDE